MAVSVISQISYEGFARDLAAFVSGGVPFALWTTDLPTPGLREIWWKAHNGAQGTETQGDLAAPFYRPTAHAPGSGALVVAYQNGQSLMPHIYLVRFDVATGTVLTAPVRMAEAAARPHLVQPNDDPLHVVLFYLRLLSGRVYLRESRDGGVTWRAEEPVLNQKVRDSQELVAVAFDSAHVSIGQVGADNRRIWETGTLTRTRPLAGCVMHPTVPDRLLVVEASARDVAAVSQLSDTLRGRLVVSGADEVMVASRVRRGTNDDIGDVALVNVAGNTPVVVDSVALPGDGNGLVRVRVTPSLAVRTHLSVVFGVGSGGNSTVVDLAKAADGTVIAVAYTDQVDEGAYVTVTPENVVSVTAGGRARACAIDATWGVVVVARALLGGGERLSYGAALTAPLTWTHKLPGRANKVLAVMTSATAGTIYVATDDRLLTYRVSALADPIRLQIALVALTRGRFMDMVLLPSGNLLAAVGEAGVAVLTPSGETRAQAIPSGIEVTPWTRNTTYAFGAHVRPTDVSPYAPLRSYFRCTAGAGGTSGTSEPPWAPAPAVVNDDTATWVEVGTTDPLVTGVCYDAPNRRIYAVGVLGGTSGTGGRVWRFDTEGIE